MQFNKPTIIFNIVMTAISLLALASLGPIGAGAIAVITGLLDCLFVLIFIGTKNNIGIKTALLFGGIFLLIGFGLCSSYPLKFN